MAKEATEGVLKVLEDLRAAYREFLGLPPRSVPRTRVCAEIGRFPQTVRVPGDRTSRRTSSERSTSARTGFRNVSGGGYHAQATVPMWESGQIPPVADMYT